MQCEFVGLDRKVKSLRLDHWEWTINNKHLKNRRFSLLNLKRVSNSIMNIGDYYEAYPFHGKWHGEGVNIGVGGF